MKVPRTIASPQSDRSVQAAIEQLGRNLSIGGISFGATMSNTDSDTDMDQWKATGTTPVGANTEFAVPHNLTRIPVGYIIIGKDIAGDIYTSTGGTAWTPASASVLGNIYLKCTASSLTFKLIII